MASLLETGTTENQIKIKEIWDERFPKLISMSPDDLLEPVGVANERDQIRKNINSLTRIVNEVKLTDKQLETVYDQLKIYEAKEILLEKSDQEEILFFDTLNPKSVRRATITEIAGDDDMLFDEESLLIKKEDGSIVDEEEEEQHLQRKPKPKRLQSEPLASRPEMSVPPINKRIILNNYADNVMEQEAKSKEMYEVFHKGEIEPANKTFGINQEGEDDYTSAQQKAFYFKCHPDEFPETPQEKEIRLSKLQLATQEALTRTDKNITAAQNFTVADLVNANNNYVNIIKNVALGGDIPSSPSSVLAQSYFKPISFENTPEQQAALDKLRGSKPDQNKTVKIEPQTVKVAQQETKPGQNVETKPGQNKTVKIETKPVEPPKVSFDIPPDQQQALNKLKKPPTDEQGGADTYGTNITPQGDADLEKDSAVLGKLINYKTRFEKILTLLGCPAKATTWIIGQMTPGKMTLFVFGMVMFGGTIYKLGFKTVIAGGAEAVMTGYQKGWIAGLSAGVKYIFSTSSSQQPVELPSIPQHKITKNKITELPEEIEELLSPSTTKKENVLVLPSIPDVLNKINENPTASAIVGSSIGLALAYKQKKPIVHFSTLRTPYGFGNRSSRTSPFKFKT